MKRLIKMLSYIKTCRVSYYQVVSKIEKELFENFDEVTVVSKNWCNKFKQELKYYPLDLTNKDVWCTYGGCTEFLFYLKDKKLHCSVTVYDGRLLDGSRTTKRFEAELILKNKFVLILKDVIESRFDDFVSEQYYAHLENEKRIWMNERTKALLD